MFALVLATLPIFADDESEIGVFDRPGEYIDLSTVFTDEFGNQVELERLFKMPTILNFVYYRCPGICSPLLSGVQDVVDKVQLDPGEDFRVITVSISDTEDHLLASQKKKNYMNGLTRTFPEAEWRWLTGDSTNIARLTQSAGFGFRRTGDDFAHGAAILVVMPDGKISRYLYGTSYNHFDLKLALMEAGEGRIGPTIAKVIKFCFSYDPEGRVYVFNFLKVSAILTLLFAGVFVVALLRKTNKINAVKGS